MTAPGAARGGTVLMVVAAAPALAALAFSAAIAVGWAGGADPFWARPELTLSEAAATRDAGEVERLIEQQGHDPNADYPVREGVLGPATSVSPVEAAAIVKRAEMVRLLFRRGASPSEDERRRLACAARQSGAGDVVAALLPEAERAETLPCAPRTD